MSSASGPAAPDLAPTPEIEATLREVVETLAPLDRPPCSPGERAGGGVAGDAPARGRRGRGRARGRALVGHVPADRHRARSRRRPRGAAVPARPARYPARCSPRATFAGIVDEAQNGPRVLRRLVRRRRTTVNLIARAGDRDGAEHARRARPSRRPPDGDAVRPDPPAHAPRARPARARALQDPLPQWWFGLAGPLATLLGRAPRPGRAQRLRAPGPGARRCSARRSWPTCGAARPCQGANDNLSGVACARRARRAAARPSDARPARAARLLRRRGDPPGRHPRVRRPSPPRARPGAHVLRQPRHGRLAPPRAARGGGAGADGGVRRALAARPVRRARRADRRSRCSAASAPAPRPTA